MMKPYIGTKVIMAETAEKDGKPGYRVRYAPDSYESWSPKEVFEEAYRPINKAEAKFAAQAIPVEGDK
jgi:uridine phosphorylase